jgi:hypothetical protein
VIETDDVTLDLKGIGGEGVNATSRKNITVTNSRVTGMRGIRVGANARIERVDAVGSAASTPAQGAP